ncbi:MAG: serine/threonine protein kinase [Gemmataceae bacterium]|nr:serine/threonine protein kinase [Gemmataceae bacterium]
MAHPANTPARAADAHPDWALLAIRARLAVDELRAAVGWWEEARQPGELPIAFLARQGVLVGQAVKEIELVRKGYVALDDFRHLFAPGGREKMRRLAPPPPTELVRTPAPALSTGFATATRPILPTPERAAPREATPPVPAGTDRVAPTGPAAEARKSSHSSGGSSIHTPAARSAVGSVIGKCLLTERVGQGGSGVVFRALHQGLGVPVAVKLLRREAEGPLATRLGHEARLLARLNHPHIVRVWDVDDDADPPYLVLEWVDGPSLDELIRQSGRLCPSRAVRVVTQVASALAEAQRAGIVHRDVKPANVLLTRDGTAKIADLGLATSADSQPDDEGQDPDAGIAGTVSHMAPELFAGSTPNYLSDQYALGVTLYQALTGQLPFPGPTRAQYLFQQARTAPLPPHARHPEVPVAVSDVVMRMLDKQALGRFASYDELLDALAALDRPPAQTPPAPDSRQAKGRRSLWDSLFGRGQSRAGGGG